MKRSIRGSILSMVIAILLLTAFQSWWLWKTYKEERREVAMKLNFMFRISIWELQTEKLRMDSNAEMRMNAVRQLNNVIHILRSTADKDAPGNTTLSSKGSTGMDTGIISYIKRPGSSRRMMYAMLGIDSLHDSLTIREIKTRLQKQLQKESLHLQFKVQRTITDVPKDNEPPKFDRNEVTIGLNHPITYRVDLINPTALVLKRLLPQILFSILLIAITIFSFWMLIKNLLRQQRLTELKNDFINNITHELKTPIATVSVAIEALKNFNAMQDKERSRDYLDISANELNRLNMLVDKVLKMSMFEKKALEIKSEPLALNNVVKDVVKSMQLQFEKQHAVVQVQQQGDQFNIMGDKMHITSVVYNLLDNALKYSKDDPQINILLQEKENEIVLAVADKGIGISPVYRNKVFEKFFRVPHGNRHDIKGYGLGLSYVAQVIKEHNGNIEVDSEEGKGATFTVHFPKGKQTTGNKQQASNIGLLQ